MRGRAPRGVTGELSPASVYVSLLPVVEACVVVAVPGRVGEVRVAADEPYVGTYVASVGSSYQWDLT